MPFFDSKKWANTSKQGIIINLNVFNCIKSICRIASDTAQATGMLEASLWMTGFVDFVHRPGLQIIRKHKVSETGSVSVFS
jgi:hypothetical protein